MAKKKAKTQAKRKVAKGHSPISGTAPPKEFQFKPGHSGNPAGGKPGQTLTARLRKILDREVSGKKIADLLMEEMAKGALKGDFRFMQEIFNRIDGKVPDKVVGDDDGPVEIVVRHITKKHNEDNDDD
jgi:hypothetical protein